ncbi:hypothetical protein E1I69_17650 [Bacillus timonensis]|uniref:Uncharacterized protein n=1 Tax=Bacillus timonensis TaxID=1033734 RepID=A0A4S3PMP7_9BACI|nr:hypothetical protein [Bacillus timonensis]THE10769.1 hypothetical protein E1I69_17650 [Bacillus timonensis]
MEFLFWPFMISSLILSILAVRLKKPSMLVISSILLLPMALYLAATPRFEIWGLVFPLFYVGAAVSLAKRIKWLSLLLIAPNFILIGWIGFSVMNQ